MNCEICGQKISKLVKIEIDKSILTVCSKCSRFGTIVRKEKAVKSLKIPKPPRIQDEEEELIENFGEIIKKRREELGISREEFAKKLGEKESVIRRIESEEMYPSRDLLLKIERLLKISLRMKVEKVIEEKIPNFNLTLGDVAIVKEGKQNK
ncbi:MAG: multiprotein bridging factor aMBF1 [Candidatus Methanomethyliaceae archaeon]|nr:multiprotein bridging factor aMBF1 [Candidatus Methanomethyliaceae archaeon]MDW7970251.1 multiprotein bridging factor aMBF1 [Nitrososphaerota archaeon]